MILYNLLLFFPFFFGAVIVGLALIYFEEEIPLVYGVNLLGSGLGGVFAVFAMFAFPPIQLPLVVSIIGLLCLLLWFISSRLYFSKKYIPITLSILLVDSLISIFFIHHSPGVHIDPYKTISYLEHIEKQSEAEKLITRYSPRAQIDVYDSRRLHSTMFAGLSSNVLPPSQMAVLLDGDLAGTIFKIDSKEKATILDFTPQSLAYRLIDSPKVLLLGEVGGINVWLAKRFNASKITVVQGNPQLNEILLNDLAPLSGDIYNRPNVRVISKEARLFIEQTKETFDIIHIVTAEGLSASSSGLQSLHEDYLLTVESIAKCYEKLTDRGFITLTRGVQAPPRDNIKVFSLFVSALESKGIKNVQSHLLQGRNYLAVNTMISKSSLDDHLIEKYKAFSQNLLIDIEYYPEIKSEEINQINTVHGPEGSTYSYFHFAARKILSQERDEFFDEWVYSIHPPEDNRPYFYDFFKWGSVGRFLESYGKNWLQRLELGYVVLVLTFLETILFALVFILLPLFWLKSGSTTVEATSESSRIDLRGDPLREDAEIRNESIENKRINSSVISVVSKKTEKLPTALYFSCLGFGFMFIEMVFIQKFTKFMGDPIYSVSVALTSILVFAGFGSLYQKRLRMDLLKRIRVAVFAIFLISCVYLLFLNSILGLFIDFGIVMRFLVTAFFLSPVSFFMGWMFPSGLRILEEGSAYLIPWAWGVNGFASVAAAPLSVLLSMSLGFSGVSIIAIALYLFAGGVAGLLKR